MAKVCMLEREKKRRSAIAKWRERREKIKGELKQPGLSVAECMAISAQLSSLPRDSSPLSLAQPL